MLFNEVDYKQKLEDLPDDHPFAGPFDFETDGPALERLVGVYHVWQRLGWTMGAMAIIGVVIITVVGLLF